MRTYMYFLIVPAVFAGLVFLVNAQDADKQRTKGKVLLLKSGHAMEGEIEKVGAQLCVRRGKSEVWIPEDKALRLCADWDDAFAFAASQTRSEDANDRVRLGFIGLGNRGDQVLDAFLTHKDCAVVAVCDIYQPYLDFAAKKIGTSPQQFRARIEADITKWSRIIEAGNIKPN